MYVTITKTIIWMEEARQKFDDPYSIPLDGRVSSKRKKRLALGKEGKVRNRRKDACADSGKFSPWKLS
jgi:hypothetical protein